MVVVMIGLSACGTPEAPRSAPAGIDQPSVPRRATMAVTQLTVSGTATSGAIRGVAAGQGQTCDLDTVEALASRHPEVGQWIVTRTDSWSATAGRFDLATRRPDGTWSCRIGDREALVGRTGTRPLLERRSGDGTTPAGVFPLGTTTAWDGQAFQFFGNGPDPGVRGTYRSVQPGDCWGATPGQSTYNHLFKSTACAGAGDEYLPSFTGSYVHAAVIGANNEPSVSGDAPGETPYAAAIFLHRHAYNGTVAKPTSGCVSLAIEDLVLALTAIDPGASPHFAIGPTEWLRTTA